MALFKSDPTKTAARDLDAAKANLARLKAKLGETEAAVAAFKVQAQTAAASNAEDSTLDKIEHAIRAAQDRAETIRSAISTVETQLAELEKAHAEAADRVQREATAAEIELLTRRCVESGAVLLKAARAHAEFVERLVPIVPEAGQVLHFALILSSELPAATELIAKLARQHRETVLAGGAAATLTAPAEPYTAPPVPPREPTQTLFATRSIRWRDEFGKQQFVGQFRDAAIPARLAGRALKSGACVPLDHPARAKNHTQGGTTQNSDKAFDLDAEPQPGPPIYASEPEFQVVDRGPATVFKIATQRL